MVVDTHLYDILGVSPDASDRDLKKAFMKKARETHPDKHKDDPDATEKFQQVNEAYEILKDPQKREIYDKYGADGLRQNEAEGAGFGDILSHLFGFPTGGPTRRRTRDIVQEAECTLEELYNGAEKNVKVKRHVVCTKCNGTGTKDGKPPKECPKCGGQGRVIVQMQQGGGIYQTISTCPDCQGRGEILDKDNLCEECKGERLVEEEKEVQLHIERGAEEGERIVFKGASDEVPDAETGDLVFVIVQKPHEVFTRKHNDLLIKHEICLSEALFGARFPIKHLDGRTLVVETNTKEVIEPFSVQMVEKEGMPIKGDTFNKGNLYIEYTVVFPKHDQLTHEFRHALCKVIPHKDMAKGIDLNAEDVTKVTPVPANIEDFQNTKRTKGDRRQEAYRSDDYDNEYGEEEGGEGVGCQPM
ncbi:hypothetical protein M9Y10_000856 [Tritrichomonas musculus]|uniref:Uncharacterized protein n=1 Tax=Tritrichomonas musculus TaxID=1915356 RepID=A0ABR2L5G4_9EUKA